MAVRNDIMVVNGDQTESPAASHHRAPVFITAAAITAAIITAAIITAAIITAAIITIDPGKTFGGLSGVLGGLFGVPVTITTATEYAKHFKKAGNGCCLAAIWLLAMLINGSSTDTSRRNYDGCFSDLFGLKDLAVVTSRFHIHG